MWIRRLKHSAQVLQGRAASVSSFLEKRHVSHCANKQGQSSPSSDAASVHAVGAAISEPAISEGEASPAQLLPAPTFPSVKKIEEHNLAHLPYRSWCKYCIMGRRPNATHRTHSSKERAISLLVGDCRVVRSIKDNPCLSLFVRRIYPFQALIAMKHLNRL